MFRKKCLLFVCLSVFFAGIVGPAVVMAYVKGIYITSGTARHARKMNYLIMRSKAAGINTFVIDVYGRNKRYAKNIAKVRQAGLTMWRVSLCFPMGPKDRR